MQDEASFSIGRIGQISVNVKNLSRAVAFYRDKLGAKFQFEAGTMAFFDCAGIRLMLAVPEKPEFDHPSSILYFDVRNLNQAFDTLSSRGVVFETKPHLVAKMPSHELWMAFFRDSENNVLAIMSERPSST
jgi:predicted enzyme related to lactoylglutathione lyase